MNRSLFVLIGTVLLALVGARISYSLLVKHEIKTTSPSWFDAICEADDRTESRRSCAEVVSSPWGTIPPIPKDTAAEERELQRPLPVLSFIELKPRPVALFGMIYFSVLAAWYIGIGRCHYSRRWWHLVPLTLNTLGVCGAAFFAYIMFFTKLEAWCPWCMVTHVINVLMWVGAILLWPRGSAEAPAAGKPASVQSGKTGSKKRAKPDAPASEVTEAWAGDTLPPARVHPTWRLALVTLAVMLGIAMSESLYRAFASEFRKRREFQMAFGGCEREIKKVQDSASTLFALYEANPKVSIPIREDDAVKNPGTNRLVAVIYSDFRCPHCARFATYMKEEIEPMFGESLKVVFKHYPADKNCNKYMDQKKRSMHPGACAAAAASEAARILGGTDAFWKAHDLLFASQAKLGKREFYLEFANQLGLDRKKFVETLASDEVASRIKEDIDLAKKIKMRGTPSLYVSGRKVPSFARSQDIFWQEVKRRYDRLLEMRKERAKKAGDSSQSRETPARPQQPATPPPTEGSQDQSIAR